MKVLLTGASGFVGSHILECLLAQRIPTAILLRRTSKLRLIADHRPRVEVHQGSLDEPDSLRAALRGVTHVIHCAGCTKALRASQFYRVNQEGTRRVVAAVNAQSASLRRLVHISSLAAAGPALPARPNQELDPPRPVSEYGKSKLAAEQEIQQCCRVEFVILRPSAVYGPGDADFLALFKAARAHLLPEFGGGRQALSLVFARDLAEAAVLCLAHPAAAGKTFNLAAAEAVTVRELARLVADRMGVRAVPLSLPGFVLWPLCLVGDGISRLTGRPGVLSRLRYPELHASGWVSDVGRIREDLGWVSRTTLAKGIDETLDWYRRSGWLR